MENQVKELYKFLSSNYQPLHDDLSYSEKATEEELLYDLIFPENFKELANQDYVCCEQKLIWYKDGYIIACLYNNHPTLRYETKEDVRDFLHGSHFDEPDCFDDNYPASKAFKDGVFIKSYEIVMKNKYEFEKNIVNRIKFRGGSNMISNIIFENEEF